MPSPPGPRLPLELFFSYSHKDEKLRAKLENYLQPLRSDGLISGWHTRKIEAGERWDRAIRAHLDSAQLILLLVSPDFLASDYCYDEEVKSALHRHATGEALVIPIILRPGSWSDAPFGRLQALPGGGKAVTQWKRQDEALEEITRGIRRAIETLVRDPTTAGHHPAWRAEIADGTDFFDRERELRAIRSYLQNRQNCQVVGPSRIGKTSLLLQIERSAREWAHVTDFAYIDLQDPSCQTLSGWMGTVARKFEWPEAPTSLADLAKRFARMTSDGRSAVLCLDEFEALAARPGEFTRDFFLTLRSCAQSGLSILTASLRPLSQLVEAADPTSPFYNTFALIPLGPFSEDDAADFIALRRPGGRPFTPNETEMILSFARGHPLALQVACFHAGRAHLAGGDLRAALGRAADDLKAIAPGMSETIDLGPIARP